MGSSAIRYTTSHPADMTDALIAAHGEVDKLMPYLHLPVQSGSDRILKAMNRSHSVESYLRTIERVRAARPDIAISGDFIVGFPGRDRGGFRGDPRASSMRSATLRLIRSNIRPPGNSGGNHGGCHSERRDGRAPPAAARRDRRAQLAFNQSSVGKDTQLLIERKGRRPAR